jgi:hypothetical protein
MSINKHLSQFRTLDRWRGCGGERDMGTLASIKHARTHPLNWSERERERERARLDPCQHKARPHSKRYWFSQSQSISMRDYYTNNIAAITSFKKFGPSKRDLFLDFWSHNSILIEASDSTFYWSWISPFLIKIIKMKETENCKKFEVITLTTSGHNLTARVPANNCAILCRNCIWKENKFTLVRKYWLVQ